MTDRQRDILLHALGLDRTPNRSRPYRNHYCSEPGCSGHDDILALVDQGLMEVSPIVCSFICTLLGVQLVLGIRVPTSEIEAWLATGDWPKRGGVRT